MVRNGKLHLFHDAGVVNSGVRFSPTRGLTLYQSCKVFCDSRFDEELYVVKTSHFSIQFSDTDHYSERASLASGLEHGWRCFGTK